MTDIGPEATLFALPPRAKIAFGAALAIGGAVACKWLWERGWLAGLPILAFVGGCLLCWQGREEHARQRELDAEIARAEGEWDELRAAIVAARAERRSVARLLQARGYRNYAVRSWIARELDRG